MPKKTMALHHSPSEIRGPTISGRELLEQRNSARQLNPIITILLNANNLRTLHNLFSSSQSQLAATSLDLFDFRAD